MAVAGGLIELTTRMRRAFTAAANSDELQSVDLKYAIVRFRPSSNGTVGAHASEERANEISGWRWRGSSWGKGRNTSFERLPVSFRVISASSRMVNSTGLPRLTGPVIS